MQLDQLEEWDIWVYGNDGTRNGAEEAETEAGLHVFPLRIYEKTYSERKEAGAANVRLQHG